jgi:hypothetical protein
MSDYNPFDWDDGTPSIFAQKERSPDTIRKALAAAKLAATRVNKPSHVGFSNRSADDRTNAIRNSTP